MRAALWRRSAWPLIALAVLSIVAAASPDVDGERVAMPALTGIWWLAGVGISVVVGALDGTAARRLAAGVFAVGLPLLQAGHHPLLARSGAEEEQGHRRSPCGVTSAL